MNFDKIKENEKLMQFLRFCVIGTLSSVLHYGIYFILQNWVDLNISYTCGYVISFIVNFYLTSYFTFKTIPTLKKFIGFAGSHGINYLLHILLFNVVIWLGVHRLLAPPCVMLIAMLVQFTILRFVFKKNEKDT